MSLLKTLSVFQNGGMDRRNFLRLMLWMGVIRYSPKFAFASVDPVPSNSRSLSLYNPSSKESFDGVYWYEGDFVNSALEKIYRIMRDTRTGQIRQIDPELLDLIYRISINLNSKEPFHVISGYRSRKTNDLLLQRGKGVAKNSYHLKGQAADIRLPGTKIAALRRAAYELKKGGLGYYPRRRFVHIDVGPVRYWRA
jgi:uncharacterized protein YcbK (DUF882 family)